MDREKLNGSGCRDPVAYEAIQNVTRVSRADRTKRDEAADELVKAIKMMVRLAGFELVDRIKFKDPKNGKKYL